MLIAASLRWPVNHDLLLPIVYPGAVRLAVK
jgi:hypothetical protein